MTMFEGRDVDGITVKVGGCEVVTRDTFHHDAEVYVLVRATVVDIRHPEKDGVLLRCHVAKPDDAWLVPQFTAARMIDEVEAPKLPGTERAVTDLPAKKAETAVVEQEPTEQEAVASTPQELRCLAESLHAPPAGVDPETGEVTKSDGPASDVRASDAGPRPSSPDQRVALSKHLAALDEHTTKEFVLWCKKHNAPLTPADMTFDQAHAALILVGDKANAGT